MLYAYLSIVCVCCGSTSFSVVTLRNRIIHVCNRGILTRYSAHLYTVQFTLLSFVPV